MATIFDELGLHQAQAEWLFCAAAFQNPQAAKRLCGWVEPNMLRTEELRRFWTDFIAGTSKDKAAIDAGIMWDLSKYITADTFRPESITSYAAVISDDIYLRQIAHGAGEIITSIQERNVEAVADKLKQLGISGAVRGDELVTAVETGLDFVSGLDDEDRTIKIGLSPLQRALGGLERRTLTGIAGRPSMGKTSLGSQITRVAASKLHQNLKVAFFSLEMSKRNLWARFVCGKTRIPYRLYKARELTEEMRQRMIDASGKMIDEYGERLMIVDTPALTRRQIWDILARFEPDIVMVDHLGLRGDYPQMKQVERLGKITREDKEMSKEFDCAWIDLIQLSRGVEYQADKRPEMKDLRGSGEIEENLDVALFLYRPDYYEKDKKQEVVSESEIIIGKNRDGVLNSAVLAEYNLQEQWFYPRSSLPVPPDLP